MSNHYYNAITGEPCYIVTGSNGKTRPTTVKDARKLGLVPSYSTIVGILDKPGLTQWMQDQIMEACIEWPAPDVKGEEYLFDKDTWKKEIKEIAGKLGRQGRERGTMVHDLLEKCYKGEGLPLDMHELIVPVLEMIDERIGAIPHHQWIAEQSFAYNGYGGKVDLHTRHLGLDGWAAVDVDGKDVAWFDNKLEALDFADNHEEVEPRKQGVILDFKTKDVDDIKKMKPYPNDVMQHAAYRDGLGMPGAACYTLFVNVRHPGMLTLHKWEERQVQKAAKMFWCLKQFWYLNAGMEMPNG
jgi:hypothetical protein